MLTYGMIRNGDMCLGVNLHTSLKLKALALEAQLVAAFASGSEPSPLVAHKCYQNLLGLYTPH